MLSLSALPNGLGRHGIGAFDTLCCTASTVLAHVSVVHSRLHSSHLVRSTSGLYSSIGRGFPRVLIIAPD